MVYNINDEKDFSQLNNYKIQSMINYFTREDNVFKINGKTLETGIINGGMAIDISNLDFAVANALIGSAGTIATTFSNQMERILSFDYKKIQRKKLILGFNNLIKTNDYEKNYNKLKDLGGDFITSGAGISGNVAKRFTKQLNKIKENDYYFTTNFIVSGVNQVEKYLKKNPGILVIENTDAGGHNGPGVGLEKTIQNLLESNLELNENKLIFAGGIRNAKDAAKVLNTGYISALQLGSIFLKSNEANISNYYKNLIINAKKGEVGPVPSPAGFPAMGFKNKGIMKEVLNGISQKKPNCHKVADQGCLNCIGIDKSAQAAGIKTKVGDYCIGLNALQKLTKEKDFDKRLFFCGQFPERFESKKQESVRKITGDLLIGIFDEITQGDKYLQKEKDYLDKEFSNLKNIGDTGLKGKIFTNMNEYYKMFPIKS